MKTAKEFREEIRSGLATVGTVRDPTLTTGKSLIETIIEEAQRDALLHACKIATDLNDGYPWPVTRAILEEIDKLKQ